MVGMIAIATAGVVMAQTSAPTRHPDPVIDGILTRLEKRRVHDLRARLRWELQYIVDDEAPQTKLGQIWYQQADPVARFKVRFDAKLDDGVRRKLSEEHLFDGNWYIELNDRSKTFTRREVRAANDRRDPYRLGEGAFPLPFGQRKEDILREFTVERLKPAGNDPPNTERIKLTPHAGTHTDETYKTIELWIAKGGELDGLPLRVRAAKRDGTGEVNSYITISFSEIELNAGLSASIFKIQKPPGYEEIVERLQPAATSVEIRGGESHPASGD
ncbi:MAG: hypothetical protein D6744_05790 [Planctomycetota bacterium]|nr:MAG: hypothetical protein D6744_05790 [Planctomycetota bacterium]